MLGFKRWALTALVLTSTLTLRAQSPAAEADQAAGAGLSADPAAAATETVSVEEMVGRIKGLWNTTGIAGFFLKEDPADAADLLEGLTHG